jgi:hypothetical protein
MCSYFATTELCRQRYVVDFESVRLIFCDNFILLFMALLKLSGS